MVISDCCVKEALNKLSFLGQRMWMVHLVQLYEYMCLILGAEKFSHEIGLNIYKNNKFF